MFPIHLVSMLRMCGAITIPGAGAGTNVLINNLIPALVGDRDNHNNLGMLSNILSHNVNIGGIPAIPSIMSMAAPDVLGLIPHVTGLPIPMQGSPNVFIGQGTGSIGLGMMQQLGLGNFGALSIGELVSVAGQVVGMVQNFVGIGGGAAIAQLSNLQGSPITPGTTVVGQTSGYSFTFGNYFDSRVLTNVVGSPYFDAANTYSDVATVSNSIIVDTDSNYDYILGDTLDYFVMEDGAFVVLSDPLPDDNYLVIDDYITLSPLMNLTASVITT
jgi:hypothetical protein